MGRRCGNLLAQSRQDRDNDDKGRSAYQGDRRAAEETQEEGQDVKRQAEATRKQATEPKEAAVR